MVRRGSAREEESVKKRWREEERETPSQAPGVIGTGRARGFSSQEARTVDCGGEGQKRTGGDLWLG